MSADMARLADLVPFRTFQRLSALRSGQLLNYSELARDAAVSVGTARRQLEKQWLGGLVIYRGDEVKKLDDFDIWAVPSYRLFC